LAQLGGGVGSMAPPIHTLPPIFDFPPPPTKPIPAIPSTAPAQSKLPYAERVKMEKEIRTEATKHLKEKQVLERLVSGRT